MQAAWKGVFLGFAAFLGLFFASEAAAAEKRIEVNLSAQRLYAFDGDTKIYDFPVSTGKPWWPTPTGEFRIWIKLVQKDMRGGSKVNGTYYYLPKVPYTMFFAGGNVARSRGYAIHGTYWHSNFGHPMSHGCVNLRTADARTLYYWADPHTGKEWITYTAADNPGTKVVIYGKTPKK